MIHTTEQEQQLHQLLELVLTELDRKAIPVAYMQEIDRKGKAFIEQAARRAPAVPETIEQRAKKLKGLQVLTGATAGVPEAIALARSRFVEAYGRSPLHDDLAYACLLIDAYGGAPVVPVPQGWKLAIGLCELVECENAGDSDFERGMRTAAKRIRKELGAAAPHLPEADHIPDAGKMVASPVQLPEPIGYAHQGQLDNISDGYAYIYPKVSPSTSCKLYTEQQVLAILTQHGIKTK